MMKKGDTYQIVDRKGNNVTMIVTSTQNNGKIVIASPKGV